MSEREPLSEDDWAIIRARAREEPGVWEVFLLIARPDLPLGSPEAKRLMDDLLIFLENYDDAEDGNR